ncbi:short chain dehydrogenase [Primorskyibacter flagellatus]|uniref:Short chain dehydrogenase n=1 Tax=Primorskyibacter flagellatus TaxID=1387277 RepID=A0A916ZWZ4_9RHOB|nr:SDR family oxidoreductase [Primorskyibacter flagellatus]GGE17426.1 short chain dehydrogenase [Primorskyibacter flagellatus]
MPRTLVTGAARRIGRAIALDLAARGHDVAVHCHGSVEAAEEVAARIRDMGRVATILRADLRREAEVARLVPEAAAGLGGALDGLINNASVFEHDDAMSVTRASWDQHMEVNLRAPFVLTQAFARQCPEPWRGSNGEATARAAVVNVIDQRVRKLTPEFLSYTLSRAALWTLTQTLAQGLAPRVRVNAVGPGPTLRSVRQSETQFSRQRGATILERGSDPEDVCAAVSYLLSSPSVTGQLICVDGGQHLGWLTPDSDGVE